MINPSLFASVINTYLPQPHASLLNGIIFGVDLHTSKIFYDELRTVGLLHIVVLSGSNITLLCVIIMQLTQFFGKLASCLLSILGIILFILFVGPKAPIVRSGVMGILTIVGIMTGRKNQTLYSLFLAFAFIAIFFPKWISTISLQLSYAASLGLIFFSRFSPKNFIIKELKTTLAAQVFSAPIIFFYFHQVSFISPLANIMVSWTIPFLMIFGFLTVILGKISFFLGWLPAMLCYGILSYFVWVVKILANIPFAAVQF